MQEIEITPEQADKLFELFNKFFEFGYTAHKNGIPLELGKAMNVSILKQRIEELLKKGGQK